MGRFPPFWHNGRVKLSIDLRGFAGGAAPRHEIWLEAFGMQNANNEVAKDRGLGGGIEPHPVATMRRPVVKAH
jgi:hypothetical protein